MSISTKVARGLFSSISFVLLYFLLHDFFISSVLPKISKNRNIYRNFCFFYFFSVQSLDLLSKRYSLFTRSSSKCHTDSNTLFATNLQKQPLLLDFTPPYLRFCPDCPFFICPSATLNRRTKEHGQEMHTKEHGQESATENDEHEFTWIKKS